MQQNFEVASNFLMVWSRSIEHGTPVRTKGLLSLIGWQDQGIPKYGKTDDPDGYIVENFMGSVLKSVNVVGISKTNP